VKVSLSSSHIRGNRKSIGRCIAGEGDSGSIPDNGRKTYKRKGAGMNFPEIVIGYLISINLIGLVLGIYGLGMAKGWWK
jgi:hypothetical protein